MKKEGHLDYNPVVFVDVSTNREFPTRSTLKSKETKVIDGDFPEGAFRALGYDHIIKHGQRMHHGVAIIARVPVVEDDRFDVVTASGGLRFVEDPSPALAEIPGRGFAIACWNASIDANSTCAIVPSASVAEAVSAIVAGAANEAPAVGDVNDTVGGVPIAVTYSPLTNSTVVFDRRIDGLEHEIHQMKHELLAEMDRRLRAQTWMTITTFTASSASVMSKTSISSFIIRAVKALSLSGRFRVIVAIPSSTA